MRKSTQPPTVIYAFARRADIVLSRHTADVLTDLLQWKEAFRCKLGVPAFRQELIEYGIIGLTTLAAGALASLITTCFM